MAIIFAYNVLVARKSEIDAKYPGGMAQFRADWMNKPGQWREDDHLLARSVMGGELREVAERLRQLGVEVLITDETLSVADNAKRCSWIDGDVYERREIRLPGGSVQFHDVTRHWLKGSDPGETVDFFTRKKV